MKFGKHAGRQTFVAVVMVSALSGSWHAAKASVQMNAVTAPVNTSQCPTAPPVLINGSFEDFSNPATDLTVATGPEAGTTHGIWHGYATGPNQILFLKPSVTPSVGQTDNYVTGWRSTSTLIEIQRQVESYTNSVNNFGQPSYSGLARSGVATASTSSENAFYDLYGPQPAEGAYWAELNAISNSALYQDIEVPSSAQLFWSIKHRGRTNTNEEMTVAIGPVTNGSATLTTQTSLQKYAPTNSDKFVGYPTYGAATSVSQIVTNLDEGWARYEGTYPADTSQSAPNSRTLRFQFGSVRGGNGWDSFGNLLDDIEFVPLLACPITKSMRVGETLEIDVTGPVSEGSSNEISYGLRHSLDAIGNSTASPSEFSTSGNTVSFTPTQSGTFSVDYQIAMTFGGSTYTAASRLTYNVSANPPAGSNIPTTTVAPTTTVSGASTTPSTTTAPKVKGSSTLPKAGGIEDNVALLAFAVLMVGIVLRRTSYTPFSE